MQLYIYILGYILIGMSFARTCFKYTCKYHPEAKRRMEAKETAIPAYIIATVIWPFGVTFVVLSLLISIIKSMRPK